MYIILRVLKKEFLQLRRDPRMFPILFIAPVFQLIFMGYAATLDIKHIGLAVWDQDRSPESTELVRHITSTLYFDLAANVDSPAEIDRLLTRGKIQAALVIPPGFGRDLGRGQAASVQAVFDGADSNQALIAQNYLSIIVQLQNAKITTQRINAMGPMLASQYPALAASFERMKGGGLGVAPEPRVFYNPELRSANFMVPGVVVMVLLVITTMLTALAVVREKEVGTMEQVIVTPIKPWQFILGKLASFVIIGFIEITVILLVAVLWFKVPFRGSLFALYAYAAVFLLTTLGLGLFVSSISQNQQQAMMTAFFIMFTMILLSGFMFPIENMPVPVQWLTRLIPMRYFLVIIRSLFLKGSSFLILWPQALALLILGVAVIGFSIQRFHKTID
jgi:ABC-2 type transport system permease protein